jgi:two-component system, NarL family, nitrate/nitrite response regulator NarL
MIGVAVVDDHPIARKGIEHVLAESESIHVLASVASPMELLDRLTAAAADGDLASALDVVILDLYYDGGTPQLDAVRQLSHATRVLVMSASGKPTDVIGAVEAGASGYITKRADPEALISAVETVAGGGFLLSSQLADIIQAQLTGRSTPGTGRIRGNQTLGTLSAREEETLDLIARGLTHAQVARRMGITKATVDTYVERIRTKLQVGNKAELTRAALQRLASRQA